MYSALVALVSLSIFSVVSIRGDVSFGPSSLPDLPDVQEGSIPPSQYPVILLNYLKENKISHFHLDAVTCPATQVIHTEVGLQAANGCHEIGGEVPVPKIGKMKLYGQVCVRSNEDWNLKLQAKLVVAGHSLIDQVFDFGPKNNEWTRDINLIAVKGSITFGVYEKCLKVKGNGCYWALNWRCDNFDEYIKCF